MGVNNQLSQGTDEYSADIKLLYFYHMGFYIFQISHSLRMDSHSKTRADFTSMLLHHCTSLGLLFVSYCFGLIRIGAVVLLLHDPADILLNFAKFFKLIRMDRICNLCFSGLCAVWFSTRIILFPYHCVYPSITTFCTEGM